MEITGLGHCIAKEAAAIAIMLLWSCALGSEDGGALSGTMVMRASDIARHLLSGRINFDTSTTEWVNPVEMCVKSVEIHICNILRPH
jgi:hypothetical protein